MIKQTKAATLLAGLFSILLILPSSSSAQDFDRSGFFIGFGLGTGSFGIEGNEGRQNSGSGYLRMGGSLNESVLLGGEVEVWAREVNGIRASTGGVNFVVYWYPLTENRLYLKGGVGSATAEIDTGILGAARETGVSTTFGAGYDFDMGSKFALTPYTSFQFNRFEDGGHNVISLGLGFSWY